MAASAQVIRDAINALVQNQIDMQNAIIAIAVNTSSTMTTNAAITSSEPPVQYGGQRGDDVRSFIAAFELWASGNATLNTSYKKKIESALSYLENDAAVWATPYIELINKANNNPTVHYPFDSWVDFIDTFKCQFKTVDDQTKFDAQEALKSLWQGRKSVVTYAALFKQYSGRTGFSDNYLREIFYDRLADRVKDGLVYLAGPTDTVDLLVKAAMAVDLRQIERAKEKGEKIVDDSPTASTTSNTIRATPYHDIGIIGTTTTVGGKTTLEDYHKFMIGRCYGCGSRNHRKAEGHHERDICNHCGITGHLSTVCRKKYFGQTTQKAKIASTIAGTSERTTLGMSELGVALKQVVKNQKAIADQLELLRKGF
jgi:hypothetical protein